MRRLSLLLLAGVGGPSVAAFGLLVATSLVTEGAVLALRAPLLPQVTTLAIATVALAPAVLALVLPLSLFVGCLACFRRWHGNGVWIGLGAAGVRARRLILPAAAAGTVVMVGSLLLTHTLAPAGRHRSATLIAASAAGLHLVPGRVVQAGPDVLLAIPDGGFFVSGGDDESAMVAFSATLEPAGDGLRLLLERGRAVVGRERLVLASFDRGDFPLFENPVGRRLELDERSDAALAEVARKREAAGQDASYEWALLAKRSTQPLVALLLPVLALPLGLRFGGKSVHAVGTVLLWWALVRIGDQTCPVLGPILASLLPALGLSLCTLLAWFTWRER
jgi:lipopolysaccharide export LptBFGC system permease protein LptF